MNTENHTGARTTGKRRHHVVPWIILGIIGYFLVMEHRAHLLQALPWILLAACPLLHIFMHRGHGDHGDPGNRHQHRD